VHKLTVSLLLLSPILYILHIFRWSGSCIASFQQLSLMMFCTHWHCLTLCLFSDIYVSTGEVLGEGSFGQVITHRNINTGKEFAVKVWLLHDFVGVKWWLMKIDLWIVHVFKSKWLHILKYCSNIKNWQRFQIYLNTIYEKALIKGEFWISVLHHIQYISNIYYDWCHTRSTSNLLYCV